MYDVSCVCVLCVYVYLCGLLGNKVVEVLFFFLIRNEEKYINRRKNTGERKDTKEREESKGRMRGPSYTN